MGSILTFKNLNFFVIQGPPDPGFGPNAMTSNDHVPFSAALDSLTESNCLGHSFESLLILLERWHISCSESFSRSATLADVPVDGSSTGRNYPVAAVVTDDGTVGQLTAKFSEKKPPPAR